MLSFYHVINRKQARVICILFEAQYAFYPSHIEASLQAGQL